MAISKSNRSNGFALSNSATVAAYFAASSILLAEYDAVCKKKYSCEYGVAGRYGCARHDFTILQNIAQHWISSENIHHVVT